MNYIWRDYIPNTMEYIETWLDEDAVRFTGLDEGFRNFYGYWAREDGVVPGENFWCKVVFENDEPFAVIALTEYKGKVTVMELVVAPEKRGQGSGSKLLKELLIRDDVLGFVIEKSEAVVYPDNIASQKAFVKAGFQYHHTHKDDDGESMYYVFDSGAMEE